MEKNKIYIILFIIVIILFFIWQGSPISKRLKQSLGELLFKSQTFNDLGITIKIPSDWKNLKVEGKEKPNYYSYHQCHGEYGLFSITMDPFSGGKNFDHYLQQNISLHRKLTDPKYRSELERFEIVGSEEVIIDGKRGYKLVKEIAQYNIQTNIKTGKYVQMTDIWVDGSDRIYSINYGFVLDDCSNQDKEKINKVIDSIKFIK